jgi:hypothetical protein
MTILRQPVSPQATAYSVSGDPISGKHQLGAVLAAVGSFLLLRRVWALPPAAPHSAGSFDRTVCMLLACGLLAYAWAVLMAVVARRLEWTPQHCRLTGYPLLALAIFAAAGPHGKLIFDTGGCFILADLAGRWCRWIAFPELGWSGKDPAPPSLSINPGPPLRPETMSNRPIG